MGLGSECEHVCAGVLEKKKKVSKNYFLVWPEYVGLGFWDQSREEGRLRKAGPKAVASMDARGHLCGYSIRWAGDCSETKK